MVNWRSASQDKVPRVLIVLTSATRRGAEVEGSALCAELGRFGLFASSVALSAPRGREIGDVEVLGSRPLSTETIQRLRRRARENDVVVAYGSKALPACALAMRGLDVPFVYRSIGDPSYWANNARRRFQTGLLMRRAAAVVALWPGAGRTIEQLYGVQHNRVHVIENARATEVFFPPSPDQRKSARQQFGITERTVAVAVIGALEGEKGVERALRCGLMLPHSCVMVAGDGSLRSALERATAGSDVRWLGVVEDVRSVLWAADVVLNTSVTEGMSGAIIEALMCGTPVVAVSVGAAADGVYGPSVRLVPQSAPDEEITDALELAVSGRAIDAEAAARFSWPVAVEKWACLLADIATDSAARRSKR